MACGAGLPILAVATTLGHFIIMFVFPKLVRFLPRERRTTTQLRIAYEDRRELLRAILVACTQLRFAVDHVSVERGDTPGLDQEAAADLADREGTEAEPQRRGVVVLTMKVKGKRLVSNLIARLSEIEGVVTVGSVRDEGGME